MKKIRTFCLLLLFVILAQTVTNPVLAAETAEVDASVTSGCHSMDAAKALDQSDKLLDTSKAVLVYEMNSNTLLYTWNPDKTIYPASMVKLMTALVALEHGDLKSVATVTRKTLDTIQIGSVSAGLKVGEQITLESLMYCMMTASANDATAVIAEHVAGSQEAFVQLMNQKAAQLGCTGTHFSNVHGLHDNDTYTTIRDVGRILQVGLENPVFRAMFEAESYTVPATNKSEARILYSKNHMMCKEETSKYYDDRVTGGKTGATDQAGRCLAVTAEDGNMRLMAIVMGAVPTYEENGLALKTHGSFEEMDLLLDYCFGNYECRQIISEDQALLQLPVSGGANNVAAAPVHTVSTVLPKQVDESSISWEYADNIGTILPPVSQGQKVSTVQVWYNGLCLAQSDLVAMHDVDTAPVPSEPIQALKNKEDNGGIIILIALGVVLGLVALAALGLLILRGIRTAAYHARHRRRRRNRRRNH